MWGSDPDDDPLSLASISDVSNGTLTIHSDQTYTYEPDVGFVGTDTFEYEVSDGFDTSDVATVTINVNKTHLIYQVYRIQDGSEEGTQSVKYKVRLDKTVGDEITFT